jgi:hypothetical protein
MLSFEISQFRGIVKSVAWNRAMPEFSTTPMNVQRKNGAATSFILNSGDSGGLILHLGAVCGISTTTPDLRLWGCRIEGALTCDDLIRRML